jgi:hypothetical protein
LASYIRVYLCTHLAHVLDLHRIQDPWLLIPTTVKCHRLVNTCHVRQTCCGWIKKHRKGRIGIVRGSSLHQRRSQQTRGQRGLLPLHGHLWETVKEVARRWAEGYIFRLKRSLNVWHAYCISHHEERASRWIPTRMTYA